MITVKQCKEISVRVLNDIGILAQLTRIVADKGVNIRAAAAWVEDENKGVVRLVTDDNLRAIDALRAHNYNPEEVDSIEALLQHTPGMLGSLCTTIGNGGVNIRYLYASAPVSEETCLVILATDNDAKALVLLNE
jgi:hypothetical protein